MPDRKHTPGPWRTDENGNIVCYPEGLSVGVLSRQLPDGELRANHLLIAAAPELLECLKDARRLLTDQDAIDLVHLDEIIAKAEGAVA